MPWILGPAAGILLAMLTPVAAAADDALIRQLILLNLYDRLIVECDVGAGSEYQKFLRDALVLAEGYAEPHDVTGAKAAAGRMHLDCAPDSLHMRRMLRAMRQFSEN
ncbi:MAG: hypothetical protein JWP26_1640 [Devosia sp.]|uniref:hypothetical protein n=1 Tax=Devosia sp. TaxID=1871048 RepID=UPI0026307318|nr:hypothetical protein [Devosia sp.]MDB5586670.1 hypothetical protein [Devosia sp.]